MDLLLNSQSLYDVQFNTQEVSGNTDKKHLVSPNPLQVVCLHSQIAHKEKF